MAHNCIIYVIKYNSLIINKLRYEKSKNYKDLREKVHIPKLTTHN